MMGHFGPSGHFGDMSLFGQSGHFWDMGLLGHFGSFWAVWPFFGPMGSVASVGIRASYG